MGWEVGDVIDSRWRRGIKTRWNNNIVTVSPPGQTFRSCFNALTLCQWWIKGSNVQVSRVVRPFPVVYALFRNGKLRKVATQTNTANGTHSDSRPSHDLGDTHVHPCLIWLSSDRYK